MIPVSTQQRHIKYYVEKKKKQKKKKKKKSLDKCMRWCC